MERIGSIDEYLAYVGRGRASAFGQRFRSQFRDTRGTAELGMLASPSEEEYAELSRLVGEMTAAEKARVEKLSDEEVRGIAERCGVESGTASIFVNGYVLARKQSAACKESK